MKILVSEYVLSTYRSRYLDLLPEAYAMTITLAKSLSMADCEVYLTISSRAPKISWDKVVVVKDESDYYRYLAQAPDNFDWIVLIAPPSELIKLSRSARRNLLGPPYPLVKIFSDKLTSFLELRRCGIKTPRTVLIDGQATDCETISELNPPYIIKPTLSAGSECVYFAEDRRDALRLASKVAKCDPSGRVLIQEYVSGIHGSISVIYGSDNYLLYSLNLQLMTLNYNRIKYVGGLLPIRRKAFRKKAEVALNKLFNCYPMLRGYIGFDVVWNEKDMYVIEVNPRATTSIIGIYEIFPELGKYLVRSVSAYQKKGEHYFLGDLVSEYAYYLLLENGVSIQPSEWSINIGGSTRTLLVGRSSSRKRILERLSALIPKVMYNLADAL